MSFHPPCTIGGNYFRQLLPIVCWLYISALGLFLFQIKIARTLFKRLHPSLARRYRLTDAINARARFDDPDLDARSQWVGKAKATTTQLNVECSRQLSKHQTRYNGRLFFFFFFTWPWLGQRLYGLTIMFTLWSERPGSREFCWFRQLTFPAVSDDAED